MILKSSACRLGCFPAQCPCCRATPDAFTRTVAQGVSVGLCLGMGPCQGNEAVTHPLPLLGLLLLPHAGPHVGVHHVRALHGVHRVVVHRRRADARCIRQRCVQAGGHRHGGRYEESAVWGGDDAELWLRSRGAVLCGVSRNFWAGHTTRTKMEGTNMAYIGHAFIQRFALRLRKSHAGTPCSHSTDQASLVST